MKKYIKRIVLVTALVFALCICVFADGADKTIKVQVVGNSITSHSPNHHWEGNWGMAASSEENDYTGVMKKLFSEEFPDWNATFTKSGIYALEKAIDINDKDYTPYFDAAFGNTMKTFVPDVVTFQFGDNVSSYSKKTYGNVYSQLVDYCRAINPNMTIVLSQPFYGSVADPRSTTAVSAAKEKGVHQVSLWDLNVPENTARSEDFYTAEGILAHPGDRGMAAIAAKFYPYVRYTALALENNASKGESKDISIWVKDKYIEMDVAPTVIDGRTMVPVRAIFEALGATVDWNQETKTASSTLGDTTVSITLDSNVMKKNGEDVTLDVAATIIDGRTLVPVRAISEAFGCQVNWLGATREVQIWD